MRSKYTIALAATLFIISAFLAQGSAGRNAQGQVHSGSADTVVRDTSGSDSTSGQEAVASPPDYVLKPWRSLRGHLHNKIIHVPIGFALSAFFLSLLALRWNEIEPAIRWLVLVAALGAFFAYLTGTSQAEALEGSSKDWVIEVHERLGISTALLLWVWAVSFWVRPLKRWSLVFGVLVVILITVTGFFGGVLAHG